MTSFGSDPGWALAQVVDLGAKIRLFIGYLEERGVAFDSSDATATGAAETAGRSSAIADVRIMAVHSLVNDITAAEGDDSGPSPEEVRLEIVKNLWLHYRWHEPWISLVNLEFPGDEPSASEVMAFEAERLGSVNAEADTIEINLLVREIELRLGDPALNDDLAVTSLAMLLYFGRMTSRFSGVVRDETSLSRRMAANEIVQNSRQPDHVAWQGALDHYFPIPQ